MKEAIEGILPIERNLFFMLNGSNSPFFDNMFWAITGRYIWALLLLFLAIMFFYRTSRREGILSLIFVILVFVVCDQVSSSLIKAYFQRPRPTFHKDFKDLVDIVREYRGGGFSFISGHATNSFGIATFLTLLYKCRWVSIPVFIWATLNSYSRIYLGLHFISDIIGGILVGTLLAITLYAGYSLIRKRFFNIMESPRINSAYSYSTARIVGISMASYISMVIIFSTLLAALPH